MLAEMRDIVHFDNISVRAECLKEQMKRLPREAAAAYMIEINEPAS